MAGRINWMARAGRTARELAVLAVILPVVVIFASDFDWPTALLAGLAPGALSAVLFFIAWRNHGA